MPDRLRSQRAGPGPSPNLARPRRCGRGCGRRIGPTAIGLAAYLAWKLHSYGEILPNTYYAKAADLASFGLGIEYLFGFVRSCPVSLLLVGSHAVREPSRAGSASRTFARYAGFALLAQAIFVARWAVISWSTA